MAKQILPLPWPKSGLVEDTAYQETPSSVTTDCLNVRNYDPLLRRNRGGRRTGLSKVISTAVGTGISVQNLTQITEALDLIVTASWGDKYTLPSVTLAQAGVRWHPDSDRMVYWTATGGIAVYTVSGTTVAAAGHTIAHATVTTATGGAGSVQTCAWDDDGTNLLVTNDNANVAVFPYSKSTGFGAAVTFTPGAGGNVRHAAWSADGAAVVFGLDSSPFVGSVPWSGSAFGTEHSAPSAATGEPLCDLYGDAIKVSPDGAYVVIGRPTYLGAYAFSSSTGIGAAYTDAVGFTSDTSFAGLDISPDSNYVVAITEGTGAGDHTMVYPFSAGFGTVTDDTADYVNATSPHFYTDGTLIIAADSASAQTNWDGAVYEFSNQVGSEIMGGPDSASVYSMRFSPDGNMIAYTISAGTAGEGLVVYGWNTATVNPTARETRLVAVAGGTVKRSDTALTSFTTVSSGSGALRANGAIAASEAFQKLFFVDGIYANYQYLDFADNTLKDWTSALTAGSLPQGATDTTKGASIIATYRGRIVLSGLKEDPQNWFMSVSGDPFDFDYSPATSSPTQAVAGNNSDVGLLGDVITCLAPYQDDVLIMGGANSLWLMRGDPASGGQIDSVSRDIGVVGAEAWCFDTVGNFYFFGRNGLYRLEAGFGSQPVLISRNKLDKAFSDINVATNFIRLVYDPIWQGVHIFVTPTSEPVSGSTCYFWDERNDAFWPDQYPASVGPTAVALYRSDNPEETGVMFGGWDGYVRQFDSDATADDGTAITSYVRFAPWNLGDVFAVQRVDDIHVLMGDNSEASTFDIYAGATVEDAEASADAGTPLVSVTLAAGGRTTPIRRRITQSAVICELNQTSSTGTWAFERAGGTGSVLSRVRGRTV